MEDRKTRYVIVKNKVWLEILYKGVPMGTRAVYAGTNKKDCERWIEENVKENR